MTEQEFLVKAIEGGWNPPGSWGQGQIKWKKYGKPNLGRGGFFSNYNGIEHALLNIDNIIELMVLMPDVWRAVNKVEGRGITCLKEMHDMVDALYNGKTISQYFETL